MPVNKPGADVYNTNEGLAFKKPTQVVGKPGVTGHDMHEDFMKSPPQNVPDDAAPGRTLLGSKSWKDSEDEDKMIPEGAMGEDIIGRKKKDVVERELIDDSEAAT